MRYDVIAALALLLIVAQSKGCGSSKPPVSNQPTPTSTERAQAMDLTRLVDSLRANGAKVEVAGEVSQPFFSVKGKSLTVNGRDIQVFEYSDARTAQGQASLVSADGSEVGRNKIGWVAPPHFYKADRIIVLYLGDSPEVVKALEAVLGKQFAGK